MGMCRVGWFGVGCEVSLDVLSGLIWLRLGRGCVRSGGWKISSLADGSGGNLLLSRLGCRSNSPKLCVFSVQKVVC